MGVCFAHFGFDEISTPVMRTMLAMVNVVQIIISKLRTLCRSHLQCFQMFRNSCLFCAFWLLQNFYSGDAHHAKYGKHSLNHHFQYCAHCVYHIQRFLKIFEMGVCFAHFGFDEISTPVMRTMLTMVNVVQINISDFAHTVYIRFKAF